MKNQNRRQFQVLCAYLIGIALFCQFFFQIENNNPSKQSNSVKELLNHGNDTGDLFSNIHTTPQTSVAIQDGDLVELEYTLWIATPDSGASGTIDMSSPYQGPNSLSFNVQKDLLINGFYYAILGMEEGSSKTFDLPANIDVDEDGYDDNSGEEVLSYGSPGSSLYNTKLRFYVRVLSIDSASTVTYEPHSPIIINGDSELSTFFDGNGTDGSQLYPHILEFKQIIGENNNYGISIKNTNQFFEIRNCIISSENYSINLENCNNVAIINCSLDGIYLVNSNHSILDQNILSDCEEVGLNIGNSNYNIICNNSISNCSIYGINLQYSINNIISGNFVFYNTNGINFDESVNNSILDNYISGNTNYGLSLQLNSNKNLIRNNHIEDNFIALHLSNIEQNVFYLNKIIKNELNFDFYNLLTNTWDNGTYGNYWSDYNEQYPNAKKIGYYWSTPYQINENNYDPFALINQDGSPFYPIPRVISITYANYSSVFPDSNLKFSFEVEENPYGQIHWIGYSLDGAEITFINNDEYSGMYIVDFLNFSAPSDEGDHYFTFYVNTTFSTECFAYFYFSVDAEADFFNISGYSWSVLIGCMIITAWVVFIRGKKLHSYL